MDYDEKSLDSAPTMGPGGIRNGGARRPAEPFEEHSIGSAPTMGGRTTPQGGRLRPGDVLLGRYTVLAELGEGGMGVVYKCLDTIGGIEVAIKCLPPELSRNESEMEGIRENYAIVARLHHSAISGLRQLEKDSEFGEYYLVMDLAKGEDLSTILRRRRGVPMPLDEVLAILRPLASALDYAHGEHVLHRDVKPANVKVDGSRVQLLDFGLAAEVRSSMSRVSLRGHAGSSGTPAYMAPEQWEARRQSAATDQYSLAVMAYEMLAGYRPFDTDNMELLKSAVLTRAPEEIEGVPAYVNAALQKALAKNSKERFASCTEFVEAISNAEPQSAQRDSHTETQRHGESISGAAKPVTRIPNSASTPPISEADVLRRKLVLTRSLKAISVEDRTDKEFAKFVAKAEDELAVAEEACKFGRFGAADESLNAAEMALDGLKKAKQAREAAARKAQDELSDVEEWLRKGKEAYDMDDFPEAARWFRLAADKGDAKAQYEIGSMYQLGNGLPQDEAESARWFRKSAEQGYADAQYALGITYEFMSEEDDTIETNCRVESAKWYHKAAEQGHPAAQLEIGNCYECGSGVAKDYAEAVKWYRLAAEEANHDAQFRLGCMYGEGLGVSRDDGMAAKWFIEAAKQDNVFALAALAVMSANGIAVPKSEKDAAKWYKCAMAQHDAEDVRNSWHWWHWRKPKRYFADENVFTLCQIIADQGDCEAQRYLASCYASGKGVRADYSEAARWYLVAAGQGNVDAQIAIGNMYYEGKGVSKDYAEALKWYRKASDQGNAWARYRLGLMHEEGQGVAKDYVTARSLYCSVAEQRNPATNLAQYRLGQLFEKGLGGIQDPSTAAKWYHKAAEAGNVDAQDCLSRLQRKGQVDAAQ